MKPDFFTYLPSEITNNILSRLPVRTIAISKCVCKPWLHLLESDEFVNSHLAKSVPALVVLTPKRNSSSGTVFEFEDGLDLEHHDLHYNPVIKFDFPQCAVIEGSANGLLFLHKIGNPTNDLYVCNPITRDYMELPYPEGFKGTYPDDVTFGFGVSKITGQHKVVRIFKDSINARYEYHVHTLGTKSWRSIEPSAPFKHMIFVFGVFVNGNLHWIVSDSNGTSWISCFDLETEHFSTFSTPPLANSEFPGRLSALGDHLCLCDNPFGIPIVIWLMKEYAVDKSWTNQYNPELYSEIFEHVYPIKVFKDGDILMKREDGYLFYYSNKTKTMEDLSIYEPNFISSILLTPTFLSLRSFGMENVISF